GCLAERVAFHDGVIAVRVVLRCGLLLRGLLLRGLLLRGLLLRGLLLRGLLLRGLLLGGLLRGLLLGGLLRGLLLRGLLLGTTGVGAVEVTGSAGLGTANRPGTDVLSIEHVLGNSDLLGARRVGRVALAAVRVPGLRAELQAAVVTVAGVGAPVAAALTLSDSVPVHAAGLCGDRG